MFSALVLASTMFISTQIQGAKAYQGEDMTDEEFQAYVTAHSKGMEDAIDFLRTNADVISRGMIGGIVGTALKNAITRYPTVGGIMLAGGVELAKEIFKEVSGDSKETRLEEMELVLADLYKQIEEVKGTVGKLRDQDIAKMNSANERADKERAERVKQGWDNVHVSDAKDCGPHKDSYHQYRDPATKEIRDTIDRIYKDSTTPSRDKEYVTKKD